MRRFEKERLYDFRKPRRLSAAQVRALDVLHRKFARSAAEALSVLARGRIDMTLTGVDQRSYSDFIASRANPTSLSLVYCLPCGQPFLLEMSPAVLFPMVERLMGGRGEETVQPVRPFTRIEQAVIGLIVERLLEALRETWAASIAVRFELAEMEHNPLLMQLVGPAEPAAVLAFEMTCSTRSGRLHLCLPAQPFDAVLTRLAHPAARGAQGEGGSDRRRLLSRLSGAPLSLSAELGALPIALADVLALRPGDVIDTQIPRSSEVALSLDGKRVFRARPVLRDGRRAVQIARVEVEA